MEAKSSGLKVLRWLAVLPVALLAAVAAQLTIFATTGRLLDAIFGVEHFSIIWAAKTVSSLFMGAAFLLVARLLAPDRKRLVSALTLIVVLLWGSLLMFSAFDRGHFFPWLFAMGFVGSLGGVTVYLLVLRYPCLRSLDVPATG